MNSIRFLLPALVWVFLSGSACAWSSRASKTYYKIQSAAMAVEEYRQNYGKLPEGWNAIRQDPQSFFAGRPDMFIDDWKRELVYRFPGLHGEFDVYSLGTDGIDNHGESDDVSAWNGVNEGYHWKKSWPLGRHTIIASCLLGIGVFGLRKHFPRQTGKPFAGLIIALGVAQGSYWLLHPGWVSNHNDTLHLVIAGSGCFALVFLILVVMRLSALDRRHD